MVKGMKIEVVVHNDNPFISIQNLARWNLMLDYVGHSININKSLVNTRRVWRSTNLVYLGVKEKGDKKPRSWWIINNQIYYTEVN